MRPFTIHNLKALDLEIPNLHPDFKLEVQERTNSWSSQPIKQFVYSVKRSALDLDDSVAVVSGNDDANDWISFMSFNRHGSSLFFNPEVARACGLLTDRHSWDGCHAAIDSLYYLSNPMNTYTVTGRLRKAIWAQLKRRCNVTKWNMSQATSKLLDLVVQDYKQRNPSWTNTQINQVLNDMGVQTFVCAFSDKIACKYFREYSTFSSGRLYYLNSLRLSELGFHIERDSILGAIWLKEDEVIIHGQVFNRNDITMGICPVCSGEYPTELIVDGECFKCGNNRYKIHSYSTKAPELLSFKAKNVKSSTIYLGIELEYETTNREIARMAVGKAIRGHAIMKSDGSLNHGFEIVSCPATLDIHLEEFKKFFSNFPNELSKQTKTLIYPDTNTGMHVHVSRKPLSMLTVGKMTCFLNKTENKKFIAYIAGRIDNHYASMNPLRTVTFPLTGNGDRYNALNLQNSATVEFRIFSTPKNWEEFAARLEFCQALTDYCQPCQVSESLKQQSNYSNFLNWLKGKRKLFPELTSHLKGFA